MRATERLSVSVKLLSHVSGCMKRSVKQIWPEQDPSDEKLNFLTVYIAVLHTNCKVNSRPPGVGYIGINRVSNFWSGHKWVINRQGEMTNFGRKLACRLVINWVTVLGSGPHTPTQFFFWSPPSPPGIRPWRKSGTALGFCSLLWELISLYRIQEKTFKPSRLSKWFFLEQKISRNKNANTPSRRYAIRKRLTVQRTENKKWES